jgi:hypothetical protein
MPLCASDVSVRCITTCFVLLSCSLVLFVIGILGVGSSSVFVICHCWNRQCERRNGYGGYKSQSNVIFHLFSLSGVSVIVIVHSN